MIVRPRENSICTGDSLPMHPLLDNVKYSYFYFHLYIFYFLFVTFVFQTIMERFAPLQLVTSPTHLYKKLEEFGKDFDANIKHIVEENSNWMESSKKQLNVDSNTEPVASPSTPPPGFKLTVDNVDYHQNVHYMTEEHQNTDKHYVSVCATENRISGSHLSSDKPQEGILEFENGKCIPNYAEQNAQRNDYVTLVGRMLVENLSCLEFAKDAVPNHIRHRYYNEASTATES